MAIPAINVLGNPNVTEGNFQIAIEDLRKSVIGSGKAYDSSNTYSQYDTCVYGGIVYYSKINSNTGNTPAINANWGLASELIKLISSPTTNALAKIQSDGTIKNSSIVEDDNGNVGIGTGSNINAKLDVNGSIRQYNAGVSSNSIINHVNDSKNWYVGLRGDTTSSYTIADETRQRFVLDVAGNTLHLSPNGGLGYGTGAGGTVTQLTSKSTSVTLNKPTGQIIMNNAALASGASVAFQFSNSLLTSGDNVYVELGVGISGWTNYRIECAGRVSENVVMLRLTNISGASLSESQTIKFTIIKGANS